MNRVRLMRPWVVRGVRDVFVWVSVSGGIGCNMV